MHVFCSITCFFAASSSNSRASQSRERERTLEHVMTRKMNNVTREQLEMQVVHASLLSVHQLFCFTSLYITTSRAGSQHR